MGRLPVGVLVGSPESGHWQSRRVGEGTPRDPPATPRRAAATSERSRGEGIVPEQVLCQQRVTGPWPLSAAGRRAVLDFVDGVLAQGDEVHGVAPGGRFVRTTRRHHLSDDARKDRGCMLPPDQIEALEALVDEVERVTAIRIDAIRGRRERRSANAAGVAPAAIAVRSVRSAASRWRTLPQCRSQRLRMGRSGRLVSGSRSRRGSLPSQSVATRRTPWNRAR